MSFHDPNNASASTSASRLPAQEKNAPEEESDEDSFTVPDLEAAPSSSNVAALTQHTRSSDAGGARAEAGGPAKVLRGRNPQNREYRRLKRLLRNRVSAQQARERKKIYVNDLESRAKDLQDMNAKLEEEISTLINENTMLRKVLVNMRPKVDESSGPHNEQLATAKE